MPPAQKIVNLKQAVAVGILAGLLVVAVVLMLDTMQKKKMWKEVDDALADGASRPLPERKAQHEHRPDTGSNNGTADSNGSIGGFRNGEPIRGVPGDGLDGQPEPPPGGSDA